MDARTKKLLNRLERIASLNGGVLTPAAVVQDARSKSSPLHEEFDWNDSEAAEKWRLAQARELIRSVRVRVTVTKHEVAAPYYVRDPSMGKAQGYRQISQIKTERDVAMETLMSELKSAIAVLERARSIAEALGLESEFDEQIERVRMLREAVSAA